MKPNHHSDPLDRQIDALLASRPLKPSDDFAARVLAQAEAETATQHAKRPLSKLIKFTLPLAAAFALTLSLLQLKSGPKEGTLTAHTNSANSATDTATSLNTAEAQEIFILEESLANLATLSTTDFGTKNLLSTLDALYLEI
ncbi:hypothetical protein SH580_07520 [Coraliomargarita algicola]|uniref:Uncharacterized protein n=1 Tax=Coraliomargarita algicola TaxID=3092156 RepID=A0ABZ0RQX6_9BACT|nr:hypothetical protein [Coraliomargarita sp. J2-16]WPJ97558.1 hypothetical protein SH580_07520 [Coraliomargarita sp. J2-16]